MLTGKDMYTVHHEAWDATQTQSGPPPTRSEYVALAPSVQRYYDKAAELVNNHFGGCVGTQQVEASKAPEFGDGILAHLAKMPIDQQQTIYEFLYISCGRRIYKS